VSYEVILTKTALKTYNRLTAKLRRGVDRCIAYLELSPIFGPNIKSLEGEPECYRYQIGGWRILYEVDKENSKVKVYEIGPRGDVYKH